MGLWLVLLVSIGLYLVLPLHFSHFTLCSMNIYLIYKEWVYLTSFLGMQFSNQLFFSKFSCIRLLHRMYKPGSCAFASFRPPTALHEAQVLLHTHQTQI